MATLVYTAGCWDLLHVGHLHYLEQARAQGDYLCVGVAADGVILQDKQHLPVMPLKDRMQLLLGLKVVDQVRPYFEWEFVSALKSLRPKVFVTSSQFNGRLSRYADAFAYCQQHDIRVVRLNRYQGESSTKIRERCL